MSDRERDSHHLPADLAELRAALHAMQAPAPDEAVLRDRFRDVAQRAKQAARGPRMTGTSWHRRAAAAVVVLAVGAALAAVALRVERPEPAPVASEAAESAPVAIGAFQPLMHSPGLSSAASYSVVRVRIPLSAFALVPGTEDSGTIEAELLVGEDGLARAIRFDEADASVMSVAQQ